MKKILSLLLAAMLAASLAACGAGTVQETADTAGNAPEAPAVDQTITAEEATGDFSVVTADGKYSESGGVITIASAGTYTVSGLLEGQIAVQAGASDEVVIELSGAKSRPRKAQKTLSTTRAERKRPTRKSRAKARSGRTAT